MPHETWESSDLCKGTEEKKEKEKVGARETFVPWDEDFVSFNFSRFKMDHVVDFYTLLLRAVVVRIMRASNQSGPRVRAIISCHRAGFVGLAPMATERV